MAACLKTSDFSLSQSPKDTHTYQFHSSQAEIVWNRLIRGYPISTQAWVSFDDCDLEKLKKFSDRQPLDWRNI